MLLILAGVSIAMLTGENGILKQAQNAKEETEYAELREIVEPAKTSVIIEHLGNKSAITPQMIAEEINEMEGRTDVTAEGTTFPTNIVFAKEDKKVEVTLEATLEGEPGEDNAGNGGDTGDTGSTEHEGDKMYSIPGLGEEAEKNIDLFKYEIIDDGSVSTTELTNLPTKTARITGIKEIYCNSVDDGYYDEETGETIASTNYGIIYKGKSISDTLVIPYQVEIDGEMYKIAEVNLSAYGYGESDNGTLLGEGYGLPKVKTIIYLNTVEKIFLGSLWKKMK